MDATILCILVKWGQLFVLFHERWILFYQRLTSINSGPKGDKSSILRMRFCYLLAQISLKDLCMKIDKKYIQKKNVKKKFRKWSYFFTCILPDSVAHAITKEFWKNRSFEKMTAGFVLRCQNLFRWNTPEFRWNNAFSGMKFSIFTKCSLYCF